MIYRKFPPPSVLSPFVECYFIWDSGTSLDQPLRVESPPTGFASIVFNYGDEYRLSNQTHQELSVPRFFLGGQAVGRYELDLSGYIAQVGIVFKPAGLSTLFNLPMFELTEERADLRSVLGKQAEELGMRIAETPGQVQKIRLLDHWLQKQFRRREQAMDRIDRVANFMVEQNGLVELDELMRIACLSRRQFERRFLAKVGVSPKYYARIRRLSRICYLLTYRGQDDWQHLIGEGGFYDQAHFIKDFKQFMGTTPSQYYQDNQQLSQFLERNQ